MPQDVQRKNSLAISNLPEKLDNPDYFIPAPKSGNPDYFVPSKSPDVKPESSDNLIDTISKHVFEPPEIVTKSADKLANIIDPTGTKPIGSMLDAIKGIPDIASNMFSNPMETMRGGLAGMTQGAASLLSPANIAGLVMPEAGIANKALAGFQGVSGVNKLAHGDVSGLADIGFGILGARGKDKSFEPSVKTNPEYFVPKESPNKLPISEKDWESPILKPGGLSDISVKSDLPITEKDWNSSALKPGGMMESSPSKPVIKDYWIKDASGKKILNPKYQPTDAGVSAVFKGWQEDGEGGHIALYDIKGGPLDRSTVSDKSLKAAGIAIPETPKFDKNAVNSEREAAIARSKRKIETPTLANLFSGETGAVRFGPNKVKPIKPDTRSLRQPSDEVIDKLAAAITEAGPKRIDQEKLYSAERARRFANVESINTKGLPGLYEKLHELKGELPKVDFTRTKLKPSEVNDLINYVDNSPTLLTGEKIRASIGLLKMLSAKREELPQASELRLLSEVFGPKFNQIIEMHGGLGGPIPLKILVESSNFSKAIMASIDMSAPLRQGLPLIHKKEWWNSIRPMIESFGSQDRFDALQESIKTRPGYLLGRKAGLALTDIGYHREEAYASKLAELIPGVKASERAFVGFLNKLRADTFDNLMTNAVDMGHDPEEIMHAVAKFVNTATGRGSLPGNLDKIAGELNGVFFSPRLIASRMTILNPNTYINKEIPAFVRQESLKSLLAIASASVTMNSLMHSMGASVNLDPTNSDFMKAKFGNSRVDMNAGVQQYIVAATRFMTGETTSSTTGKTSEIGKRYGSPSRISMLVGIGDKYNRSFLENKFSPLVGLIDDMYSKRAPETQGLGGIAFPNHNQKNPSIMKGDYAPDVINKVIPLMVNDLIDIYRDDPNHMPLGIGAFFGAGVQTYKPTPKKNPLRISVR